MRKGIPHSTIAQGRRACAADRLVETEKSIMRITFGIAKPVHRKSADH